MLIKFIDCTETQHETLDNVVNFLSNYFTNLGIKNQRIKFADLKIAKCTQCRCCTLKKGENPVKCVIKDDMNETLDEIEEATAYVILADRNHLFSKNKIHEKVSERLVAYYYWPYTQNSAQPRRLTLCKSSILINYNTTKYFMNHSFYTSKMYMEHTSNAIGAKVIDWLALTPTTDLTKTYIKRLKQMADNLIESIQKKAS